MFTIDINLKDLNLKKRNLVKAFFSMNNHQVATPEMMSEEARSYVVFFREADARMSAYIGIHLLLTGRKLFYFHTSNPFSERDADSVEEEARSFAEGLGAMLDEVNLATMSRDEKERWIDAQDFFSPVLEKASVPEPPASPVSAAEPPLGSPQPPQSPSAPPVQDTQQDAPTQPVPAPPAMAAPPPPIEQQTQQQPARQPISSEPIVPESGETQVPAAQTKTRKQKEKAAPAARTQEESREVFEQASTKAARASTASKERLEIIQEAIKAGIVKPLKPMMKKDVQTANGIVSRDREALARLLASF